MDSIEFRPQELSERSEGTESAETQALEDATFEPTAFIEQSGDFRQAEAVQSSLETVMANIPGDTVEGQQPQVVEGAFEKSPGKDDGGEDITPINLPGIQEVAGGETGFKYDTKESAGMGETPLPATAGEASSGAEQVGTLPMPVPRPAGEASAGVEQVGVLPDPLPRPAGMISGTSKTESAEDLLNSVGDDAQLANIDLANVLAKQQQLIAMINQVVENSEDTVQSTMRNMK